MLELPHMKEGMPTSSNDNEKKEEVEIDRTNVLEFRQPQEELSENEEYEGALQEEPPFLNRLSNFYNIEPSFARDRERIQETLDRLKEHQKEVPVTQEELERKWGEEGEETLKLGAQLYPAQFPTTEKSALTGNFNTDLNSEMEHRREKDTKNRQQAALGVLGLGVVSTGAAIFSGAGLAAAMAIGGPATLAAGLGVYGGMKLYQGIRNRRFKKNAIKYAQDQKLQEV